MSIKGELIGAKKSEATFAIVPFYFANEGRMFCSDARMRDTEMFFHDSIVRATMEAGKIPVLVDQDGIGEKIVGHATLYGTLNIEKTASTKILCEICIYPIAKINVADISFDNLEPEIRDIERDENGIITSFSFVSLYVPQPRYVKDSGRRCVIDARRPGDTKMTPTVVTEIEVGKEQ